MLEGGLACLGNYIRAIRRDYGTVETATHLWALKGTIDFPKGCG